MKRWGLTTLLWLLTASMAFAAEPFEPGRHYTELPFPQPVETGDKIELREFFWYGCPHCYVLEPALNAYVRKLPANVKFVRTPGVAPSWLMHAQTFYTFEVLGVSAKLHAPFFDAWHAKGQRLNDEAGIAAFAAQHGVDQAKFRETFNSFAVRTRLERAKHLNVAFMVDSVPMLAVDGRYLTSPVMAGGAERDEAKRAEATMKVVDFLVQKAARERRKTAPR
jgi:thiol:disulfide interchange protein DsbA